MTITEANAVNELCTFMLGPLNARTDRPIDAARATSALATLAERANKALMCGFSGGAVVARAAKLQAIAERTGTP